MGFLEVAKLFALTSMVFFITGRGSGPGEMMASTLDVNGTATFFVLG